MGSSPITYTSIQLRTSTKERFAALAKAIGKTYSDTLEKLMDIFEKAGEDAKKLLVASDPTKALKLDSEAIAKHHAQLRQILIDLERAYFVEEDNEKKSRIAERIARINQIMDGFKTTESDFKEALQRIQQERQAALKNARKLLIKEKRKQREEE